MMRFAIDTILFLLILAELSFNYLPKDIHEILGVATVILGLVHVSINGRRFITLFKKMSPKNFFSIEVDFALMLSLLVILITGLCMSNYLFPNLVSNVLQRNMTLHNLHTSAPYATTILIGMHIGLHCREIMQKLLKLLGAEKIFKRWKLFFQAIIITLATLGVLGLYLNNFIDRILMKHIFATAATDLPLVMFSFLLFCSIIFFALITFLIVERFFKE